MLQIKRILIPIDFSEHSEVCLAHALEMASTYEAQADLLHVIEEPTLPAIYGAVMHEVYGQMPNVEDEVLEALQSLLLQFKELKVDKGLHVIKGEAEKEIIKFATEQQVDLIVMASHGLSGLEHLLLGSVAEKVIRQAPCPVLIVNPFGKSLLPQKKSEGTAE